MAWDKTRPSGSTAIQSSDQLLRDNFAGIEEGLVPFDYLSLQVQGSDPTPSASFGYLYAKDISSKGELHYIDEDSNVIPMTKGGQLVAGNQSCFLAYNGSDDTSATGDATVVTVEFDTEVHDQGSDFNNSTDTYTCPVDAKVFLYTKINVGLLTDGTHDEFFVRIVTSNRTYQIQADPSGLTNTGNMSNGANLTLAVPCADMDANDTAYVTARVSGGTKGVKIVGGDTSNSYFGGVIIC